MPNRIRDTYKYWFQVKEIRVHSGITINLSRREAELKKSRNVTILKGEKYYWSEGHLVKVGNVTTRQAALKWITKHKKLEVYNYKIILK